MRCVSAIVTTRRRTIIAAQLVAHGLAPVGVGAVAVENLAVGALVFFVIGPGLLVCLAGQRSTGTLGRAEAL